MPPQKGPRQRRLPRRRQLRKRAAAERAVAERAAAEKAAAIKAAAEKAEGKAEAPAPHKAAPSKQVASAAQSHGVLLQAFIQKKGAAKVLRFDPPDPVGPNPLPLNEIVYVNDGSCPKDQIQQVTGGDRVWPRSYRCVTLTDWAPQPPGFRVQYAAGDGEAKAICA